jgi:hypothetical protein
VLVVLKLEKKKREVGVCATAEDRLAAEESLRNITTEFESSKVDRDFQEKQLLISQELLEGQRKRAL